MICLSVLIWVLPNSRRRLCHLFIFLTPLRRFDVVALDILSFGKQCKNGFDSFVVFTDQLSKRAYIAPCYKTSTAADLARIFFETVWKLNARMCRQDRMTGILTWCTSNLLTTILSMRPQVLVPLFFNLRNLFAPWDLFNATEPDENHRGNSDLASSLGLDIITNITAARDALHKAARDFRLRHAATCKPHSYKVGDAVLLSTKNLRLKLPCRILSPAFIGPFRIEQLRGSNAFVLDFTDRWKHLHEVVNIEYLRPYSLLTAGVGPGPQSLSVKPISVDPDGSSWYQIAEIWDHLWSIWSEVSLFGTLGRF
jgi:hypothetical protein